MTLPELYTALCLLWGVDEIEDEHAIALLEAGREVVCERVSSKKL